jgi:hypothetical protein
MRYISPLSSSSSEQSKVSAKESTSLNPEDFLTLWTIPRTCHETFPPPLLLGMTTASPAENPLWPPTWTVKLNEVLVLELARLGESEGLGSLHVK